MKIAIGKIMVWKNRGFKRHIMAYTEDYCQNT